MPKVKSISSHPKYKPQGRGTRIWLGQRFMGHGAEAPACLIDACGDAHAALLLKHLVLLGIEATPVMSCWEEADAAICITRSGYYRKLAVLKELGFISCTTRTRGGGTWVDLELHNIQRAAKTSRYYHEIK